MRRAPAFGKQQHGYAARRDNCAPSVMLLSDARALERSTGMCPARFRCVPRNGIRYKPFLAKKRN